MFRSAKYVQRYEFVRFQLDNVIIAPANGQHQQNKGYKFTVNDRSAIYDWYNAYFEVQFKLNKLDGTGGYAAAIHDDNRATVINGAHSLINKMTIKSAGKIVYDTSNICGFLKMIRIQPIILHAHFNQVLCFAVFVLTRFKISL